MRFQIDPMNPDTIFNAMVDVNRVAAIRNEIDIEAHNIEVEMELHKIRTAASNLSSLEPNLNLEYLLATLDELEGQLAKWR